MLTCGAAGAQFLFASVQDQLVVNCRAYIQETALSRRVKAWEDKIRPELVLQVKCTGCGDGAAPEP